MTLSINATSVLLSAASAAGPIPDIHNPESTCAQLEPFQRYTLRDSLPPSINATSVLLSAASAGAPAPDIVNPEPNCTGLDHFTPRTSAISSFAPTASRTPVECASLKPAEGKPVGSVAKFDDLIYPVGPKTMFCVANESMNAVTAAIDSK